MRKGAIFVTAHGIVEREPVTLVWEQTSNLRKKLLKLKTKWFIIGNFPGLECFAQRIQPSRTGFTHQRSRQRVDALQLFFSLDNWSAAYLESQSFPQRWLSRLAMIWPLLLPWSFPGRLKMDSEQKNTILVCTQVRDALCYSCYRPYALNFAGILC